MKNLDKSLEWLEQASDWFYDGMDESYIRTDWESALSVLREIIKKEKYSRGGDRPLEELTTEDAIDLADGIGLVYTSHSVKSDTNFVGQNVYAVIETVSGDSIWIVRGSNGVGIRRWNGGERLELNEAPFIEFLKSKNYIL